jgi:hypothetical protein
MESSAAFRGAARPVPNPQLLRAQVITRPGARSTFMQPWGGGLPRGEIVAVEAIDALLTEELTICENRRVKMAANSDAIRPGIPI